MLTAIEAEALCSYEECGKKYFGRGRITKKPCCSGHYKREERQARRLTDGLTTPGEAAERISGQVRRYGAGSNSISTKVTNETLAFLQVIADRSFEGKLPLVLREIINTYVEGNTVDSGEVLIVEEDFPGAEAVLETQSSIAG